MATRVHPVSGPCGGAVALPGSKSLTNRALVLAALAPGESVLAAPADCEDTRLLAAALTALGIAVTKRADAWRVAGGVDRLHAPNEPLKFGNAGTAIRFATALAACVPGTVRLDGNARMRQRPIGALTDALSALGAGVVHPVEAGFPPIEISGRRPLAGGQVTLDARVSSQFVTALLLIGAATTEGLTITLPRRPTSAPYVAMTLALLPAFSITALAAPDFTHLEIAPGLTPAEVTIEADASGASYPLAIAALTGGAVTVTNLGTQSVQGDLAMLDAFARFGCRVEATPARITLAGPPPGGLRAIALDGNAIPDVVPTLAMLAARARGESRFTNIANLRVKECDRLAVLAAGLERLGIEAAFGDDWLSVTGVPEMTGENAAAADGDAGVPLIETAHDHRMAMCFACLGLTLPRGLAVDDDACVAKSFPSFWNVLAALRQ